MLRTFCDGALFGERLGGERLGGERLGGERLGGDGLGGPLRVVALHGWGRERSDLVPAVEGYEALSLDLPGFGVSPAPPEAWGASQYADLVARALVEAADGEPVVLVGHSFGGRVATCLAANQPRLVSGLVLTGVPLLRPESASPSKSPLGYRLVKRLHRIGVVSDERLESAKRKHGSADYRNATGVMRDVLVRLVNETYGGQLDASTCPVELVWGELDTAAPLEVAQQAAERIDDARLTVVAGGSHDDPIRPPADELRAGIDRLLLERAR